MLILSKILVFSVISVISVISVMVLFFLSFCGMVHNDGFGAKKSVSKDGQPPLLFWPDGNRVEQQPAGHGKKKSPSRLDAPSGNHDAKEPVFRGDRFVQVREPIRLKNVLPNATTQVHLTN